MKINKLHANILIWLFGGALCMVSCKPIRNLTTTPDPWQGQSIVHSDYREYDPARKNVFIVADPRITEIFDMLAPFYLFNITGKANVFIVAESKTPILIKKDLFVCPQLTFREADSLQLIADVMVIPALSARDKNQDTVIVSWIRRHYGTESRLLSICDGASTGAATGLYDGKPLTCHASDINSIKPHFAKPEWVQHVTVARSGHLYSTAGVSNAVEGSLAVIQDLFGDVVTKQVMADIMYPRDSIRFAHTSITLDNSHKRAALKKVLFRKNKRLGVLLRNGISELEMAALIDTYGRTLPSSFTFHFQADSVIQTKFGLTIVSTSRNRKVRLDELHIPGRDSFVKTEEHFSKKVKLIRYDTQAPRYFFDMYLERIGQLYGRRFQDFVRVSLDYN